MLFFAQSAFSESLNGSRRICDVDSASNHFLETGSSSSPAISANKPKPLNNLRRMIIPRTPDRTERIRLNFGSHEPPPRLNVAIVKIVLTVCSRTLLCDPDC
jgi:hypothetical protein